MINQPREHEGTHKYLNRAWIHRTHTGTYQTFSKTNLRILQTSVVEEGQSSLPRPALWYPVFQGLENVVVVEAAVVSKMQSTSLHSKFEEATVVLGAHRRPMRFV